MTIEFFENLSIELANAGMIMATALRDPSYEETRKSAFDVMDFVMDATFALQGGSEKELEEFAKKHYIWTRRLTPEEIQKAEE